MPDSMNRPPGKPGGDGSGQGEHFAERKSQPCPAAATVPDKQSGGRSEKQSEDGHIGQQVPARKIKGVGLRGLWRPPVCDSFQKDPRPTADSGRWRAGVNDAVLARHVGIIDHARKRREQELAAEEDQRQEQEAQDEIATDEGHWAECRMKNAECRLQNEERWKAAGRRLYSG